MGMTEQERQERKALLASVEEEQQAAREAAVKALRQASEALEDMARVMLLTEHREWRRYAEAHHAIGLSGQIDAMIEGLS